MIVMKSLTVRKEGFYFEMAALLENGLNSWLVLCLWVMNAMSRACLDTNMTGLVLS